MWANHMRLRENCGMMPKSAGRRAFCFPPSEPGRVGVVIALLAAIIWGAILADARGATAASSAAPYDIMVMVAASGGKPAQVAISYPEAIDQASLRAGIAELGRRGRFTAGQVVIRDAPLAQQVSTPGTDAQFVAPGLIDASGRLPVGPIIRSLPKWNHMRLVFLLDPNYPFSGPADVSADGLSVRLVNRVATYEYDVERISGKPSPAGEASGSAGAAVAQASGAEGESPRVPGVGHQVLPAVLIGLPSGLLAGWLLYGWWGRRGRARRAVAVRPGGSQPTTAGKSGGSGQSA